MPANTCFALILVLAVTIPRAAGGDVLPRIDKATAVLDKLGDCLGTCMTAEEFGDVQCVAVIPHFYRGAAVAGEVFEGGLLVETSFGRGFLSCRSEDRWSVPRTVTLRGGRERIQIGKNIDLVIVWSKKQALPQMSSPHIPVGEAKILILGHAGKTYGGTGLQRAELHLHTGGMVAMDGAQPFVSRLSALFRR